MNADKGITLDFSTRNDNNGNPRLTPLGKGASGLAVRGRLVYLLVIFATENQTCLKSYGSFTV